MEPSSSREIQPIPRIQTPASESKRSSNETTDEVLTTELGPIEYEDATLQKPPFIVHKLCSFTYLWCKVVQFAQSNLVNEHRFKMTGEGLRERPPYAVNEYINDLVTRGL